MMKVSMKDYVSPDFLLAVLLTVYFNLYRSESHWSEFTERSRGVGLGEIEFNKQSVKPLDRVVESPIKLTQDKREL